MEVLLRDEGKRHDWVSAALYVTLSGFNPLTLRRRVLALEEFLGSKDGADLLAAYRRAANILDSEEKKGRWSLEDDVGDPEPSYLVEPAEKELFTALQGALPGAITAVRGEEFAAAMKALAGLRAPVDGFFDKVLVNAPEEQIRRNRLLLLSRFREALSAVADFSKIEG